MKHYQTCVLLGILILSCKKNSTHATPTPPNNNVITANVDVASGASYKLNAKGTNAKFGGAGSLQQIVGLDAQAVLELDFSIVSGTGTYPYLFTYYVDQSSVTTPIYSNNDYWVAQPGFLTVTILNGKHIEGSFSGIGKMGLGAADSAFITGTFRGDF